MSAWQIITAEKMSNFIRSYFKTEKIEIGGSVLTPADIDRYSDVDMEITLLENIPIDIKAFLNAAGNEFSPVFGYEVISHARKDAIRVSLENGMRFDLVFRYNCEKSPQTEDNSLFCKIESAVNQFWFMASMVLVKLGRNDNLIAAHLALELCQLIIVIQMLVRDNEKGTNIHRFGDNEDIPVLHLLMRGFNHNHSSCGTSNEILSILFAAAAHMDEITEKYSFPKKYDTLSSLAEHFFGVS